MYDINNLDELYRLYGGQTYAANQLGITQPAVSRWKKSGVAGGRRMRIACDLVDMGLTFNPAMLALDGHLGAVKLLTYIEKYRGELAEQLRDSDNQQSKN